MRRNALFWGGALLLLGIALLLGTLDYDTATNKVESEVETGVGSVDLR